MPVVVAVSGGRDSMLLLRLLESTTLELIVAHVHYGLRSDESEGDAAFVADYCREHALVFELLDLKGMYAKECGGVQDWARAQRYAFFEQVKNKYQARAIAIAHHQADQSETILYQFLRGGGLASLRGMRIWNDGLWRPLLAIPKSSIESEVVSNGIVFREDSSNAQLKYTRNKIRQEAAVVLEEVVPQWAERITKRAEQLAEVDEYIRTLLLQETHWFDALSDGVYVVQIATFRSLAMPKYRLWFFCHELGLSSKATDEIWRLLDASVGKFFVDAHWRVMRERGQLRFIPAAQSKKRDHILIEEPQQWPVVLDGWRMHKLIWEEAQKRLTTNAVALRWTSLTFPLVVRPMEEGDKIQPFGMQGHKRLSRVLIQAKVERSAKEEVRVWASESSQIYWIEGLMMSEQCRAQSGDYVLFIEKVN
jgi:tRNA(Ile)-lysidine synthase